MAVCAAVDAYEESCSHVKLHAKPKAKGKAKATPKAKSVSLLDRVV